MNDGRFEIHVLAARDLAERIKEAVDGLEGTRLSVRTETHDGQGWLVATIDAEDSRATAPPLQNLARELAAETGIQTYFAWVAINGHTEPGE